jgi:hypothetical protein
MPDVQVSAAQPNPPGRDTIRPGLATNSKLNEEWVELLAISKRNMVGDVLANQTYDHQCRVTSTQTVCKFPSIELDAGDRLRVHTGSGSAGWVGRTYHYYLGRSWFVWNNACGDCASLWYNDQRIDFARYDPRPPEGVLVRIAGTNLLQPQPAFARSLW